jgi:hypothetical protein
MTITTAMVRFGAVADWTASLLTTSTIGTRTRLTKPVQGDTTVVVVVVVVVAAVVVVVVVVAAAAAAAAATTTGDTVVVVACRW